MSPKSPKKRAFLKKRGGKSAIFPKRPLKQACPFKNGRLSNTAIGYPPGAHVALVDDPGPDGPLVLVGRDAGWGEGLPPFYHPLPLPQLPPPQGAPTDGCGEGAAAGGGGPGGQHGGARGVHLGEGSDQQT